jgi:hypothetical protein
MSSGKRPRARRQGAAGDWKEMAVKECVWIGECCWCGQEVGFNHLCEAYLDTIGDEEMAL